MLELNGRTEDQRITAKPLTAILKLLYIRGMSYHNFLVRV